VRELRNAVERAVAMMAATDPSIPTTPGSPAMPDDMTSLFSLPFKDALERWTARFERGYLEHALRASGGSVSGAARAAGVNRRFMQRLMARLDMRDPGPEDDDDPDVSPPED